MRVQRQGINVSKFETLIFDIRGFAGGVHQCSIKLEDNKLLDFAKSWNFLL